MKKNKIKIIFGLVLILFLTVAMVLSSFKKQEKKGSDYKIGILADDGIAIVTISKERQMINFLSLSPDSQIWLPGGMGWYRNQVIKKILVQEKKTDLISDVLFYNFGFVTDKVVVLDKTSDWKGKFWWRLLWNNNLINKTEELNGDVDKNEVFLDKVMVRDFSETKIVNDDLKISVINSSSSNGLANFVTEKMERAGFSVVSVDNGDDVLEKCQLLYGDGVEETFSWQVIRSKFNCESFKDSTF